MILPCTWLGPEWAQLPYPWLSYFRLDHPAASQWENQFRSGRSGGKTHQRTNNTHHITSSHPSHPLWCFPANTTMCHLSAKSISQKPAQVGNVALASSLFLCRRSSTAQWLNPWMTVHLATQPWLQPGHTDAGGFGEPNLKGGKNSSSSSSSMAKMSNPPRSNSFAMAEHCAIEPHRPQYPSPSQRLWRPSAGRPGWPKPCDGYGNTGDLTKKFTWNQDIILHIYIYTCIYHKYLYLRYRTENIQYIIYIYTYIVYI